MRILQRTKAVSSAVEIVERMMSRELPPTSSTVTKFMLKPIKTMLACRIFLELKRIPFSSHVGRRKKARIMPKRMAKNRASHDGDELSQKPGRQCDDNAKTQARQGVFQP